MFSYIANLFKRKHIIIKDCLTYAIFPKDIWIEIFSYVPLDYLLIDRRVCKSWYTILNRKFFNSECSNVSDCIVNGKIEHMYKYIRELDTDTGKRLDVRTIETFKLGAVYYNWYKKCQYGNKFIIKYLKKKYETSHVVVNFKTMMKVFVEANDVIMIKNIVDMFGTVDHYQMFQQSIYINKKKINGETFYSIDIKYLKILATEKRKPNIVELLNTYNYQIINV